MSNLGKSKFKNSVPKTKMETSGPKTACASDSAQRAIAARSPKTSLTGGSPARELPAPPEVGMSSYHPAIHPHSLGWPRSSEPPPPPTPLRDLMSHWFRKIATNWVQCGPISMIAGQDCAVFTRIPNLASKWVPFNERKSKRTKRTKILFNISHGHHLARSNRIRNRTTSHPDPPPNGWHMVGGGPRRRWPTGKPARGALLPAPGA